MNHRKTVLLTIFLAATVLLTSCAGGISSTSWPGMSVDGDTLYVSYATAVYSIRLADGNLNWKFPVEGKNSITFYAPAAVAGDQVLVGSYQNILYSINPDTGAEKWTYTGATGRYVGSVLTTGEQVFAPDTDSNLYALSAAGQEQWVFEDAAQALWAPPVSDGSTLYQGSMDHLLYAIDQQTGVQDWKIELDGSIVNAPLLVDDTLYVTTLAGTLYAVSTETHQILWQSNIGSDGWGSPVLHEGVLYLGDLNGQIYGLSVDDGSELWKLDAGGAVVGSGSLTENGVVFVTETGNVILVGFDGVKTWTKTIEGKLYGHPAIGDDRIVVSVVGGENLLVAYDFGGNIVWSFTPEK